MWTNTKPTNTVIFSPNYCVTIAYYVRHPISTKYSLSLMIDSSLKCYRKPSLRTPVGRQAAVHHQIVTDRTSSARKLLLIPLADKSVCRVVAQQIRLVVVIASKRCWTLAELVVIESGAAQKPQENLRKPWKELGESRWCCWSWHCSQVSGVCSAISDLIPLLGDTGYSWMRNEYRVFNCVNTYFNHSSRGCSFVKCHFVRLLLLY